MLTNWLKQGSAPLFKELEWSKPERRDQAGSLLIIGGTTHSLSAPAHAYETVIQSGVGRTAVVLPDKSRKLVEAVLPDAVFLPSTVTGEFSKEGEHELLEHCLSADGLLLPGDVGKNSQTSMLFEAVLSKYAQLVIITGDAIESVLHSKKQLLEREHTTLILSFAQLQKLLQEHSLPDAITSSMNILQLIERLHQITLQLPTAITLAHQQKLIVAHHGNVSTTGLKQADGWREQFAAYAACYQIWNPHKPFEALTHAAYLAAVADQSGVS